MRLADLGTRWAQTEWHSAGPVVCLNFRLTAPQQTMALTHELHHVEIGGVCSPRCPRNEKIVVRETREWLLPDAAALAQQLRCQSVGRVARLHGVPSSLVLERMRSLSAAEQSEVNEIMCASDSEIVFEYGREGVQAAAR